MDDFITSPEQGDGHLEELADTLVTRGFALRRDFLSRTELEALALDCKNEWLSGTFAPAHVGRGSGRELRREMRGDHIRWLEQGERSTALRAVLARIESLRTAINRRAFLGLFDLECHYAIYPAGARYHRHLDTFRDVSHRVVSWVLYMNEDWADTDGGQLRVYAPDKTESVPGARTRQVVPEGVNSKAEGAIWRVRAPHSHPDIPRKSADHFDVAPIGGTFVTFLSAEYEHEVLPARRERASLTGWFTTRR
jgi:SM-20-related protein